MATSIEMTLVPSGTVKSGAPFAITVAMSATDDTPLSVTSIRTNVFPKGYLNSDPSLVGTWTFGPDEVTAIPLSGSGTIEKTNRAIIYNTVVNTASFGVPVYGVTVDVFDSAGVKTTAAAQYVSCSAYQIPA